MRFAFDKCNELGIDDPVAWLNAVPPVVIDGWIAHRLLLNEEASGEDRQMMDPAMAGQLASKMYG